MTNVDQFESVFRSAAKEVFAYVPPEIGAVMVLTDLDEYEATLFADRTREFLRVLGPDDRVRWRIVRGDEYRTVPELLGLIETDRPDLVCTYRHLHSEGWRLPFTLGDHVEVLTQATPTPIMLLPHPRAGRASEHAVKDTTAVMGVTDHISGDHRLVNAAAHFTERGGTLYLTHVEDAQAFERYIETIGKIPEIDTELARETIERQLLKEPADFIVSCRTGLDDAGLEIEVESVVVMGRRLLAYRRLIGAHEIDLLVFNTKDDDQLAMHGLAHPLAVELREIPLLML